MREKEIRPFEKAEGRDNRKGELLPESKNKGLRLN